MAAEIEIREAQLEDADAIGEVHVLAWQRAYRGLMPDEYLDGLSIAERQGMWRENLSADGGSTRILVATRNDDVCGFAIVGPVRDEDADRDVGELYAINMHPDVWRQGIGRVLLASCVEALAEQGYRRAILWVLVGNDRARRFYETLGWTCDGIEKHGSVMGADTHEIRYSFDLG